MNKNVYQVAIESIEDHKGSRDIFILPNTIKDDVKAEISMGDFSKEFLFEFYLSSMVTTALNTRHCYSSKRGSGKYVNVDACKDINLLNNLIANAQHDMLADNSRIAVINSRIKELNEDQYIMNIDDPDAEICTIGDVLDMVM